MKLPAHFIRTASAVAIVSLFAGCTTWDNMSKREQSTTVGAASGAVGGAAVAGPPGAVVGGVAGGVAGNQLAKSDTSSSTTH